MAVLLAIAGRFLRKGIVFSYIHSSNILQLSRPPNSKPPTPSPANVELRSVEPFAACLIQTLIVRRTTCSRRTGDAAASAFDRITASELDGRWKTCARCSHPRLPTSTCVPPSRAARPAQDESGERAQVGSHARDSSRPASPLTNHSDASPILESPNNAG
ncbi:hypothetical protein B0H12DRAFT_1324883 [Mycena haematopus]|nr:hypothetical protein B0H12DRAFT_1324883 [Mycena haematopus]